MASQRPIFGSRLHEALHLGGIGGNKPKRGECQLHVVLGFFYVDLREFFASPIQLLLGEGSIVEVSNLEYM